ncbi:Glycosyl transferase family 2 [Flavobacteriaceae bacterium MAR_2010_188]|nr:Glycosyl transferase family 2 [Flavobacteriaceae bacterium MAR_2010_188]
MKNPIVSVCLVTFQQEKYIKETIIGVLNQVTNFEFELVIGEDNSTDRTYHICKKYAKKYPEKIRLIQRNQPNKIFVNGRITGTLNLWETLQDCRGKYIAQLDGDDYWTDPLKLQKQFDFLENNPDYSVVGHNCFLMNGTEPTHSVIKNVDQKFKTYLTSDLIEMNPYIHSMTMYVKPNYDSHKARILETPYSDWEILTLCSLNGKCAFFDEVVGYFRVHNNSYSFDSRHYYKNLRYEFLNRIKHAEYWNAVCGGSYQKEENSVKNRRGRYLTNQALRNFKLKDAVLFSGYITEQKFNSPISKFVFHFLSVLNKMLSINKKLLIF